MEVTAMSDKVRVGIIGSGFIGNIHFMGLNHVKEADVVAVASKTPGKAAKFAQERGIPNAYEDYRKILERDDIDAVTVGVPNYLHEEVVIAAAVAGKHIMCEKPFARTIEEAQNMLAAVKQAG